MVAGRYPVIALILGIMTAFCAPASSAEIWLAGVDPYIRHLWSPSSTTDYMDLFKQGAPWKTAAREVRVFKTSSQWLISGGDDDLRRMFFDLNRRHIALGVEALMLSGSDGCGGVEGYEGVDYMSRIAARVYRLGGRLDYVAMDEPLWFGHHYNGPHACHSSLDQLAQDVARKVRDIRRVFPEVQIGDIEPIANANAVDWVDQILAWAGAYHAAVGEQLAFVHADVQWVGAWQQQLALLADRLHAARIKLGIVYNGDATDLTGEAWTDHAAQRFLAVEADPALVPDQAILQTWEAEPSRMLPDTQPGTMTHLVRRYAAAPTALKFQRTAHGVSGHLRDVAERPVAGVRVTLREVDNGTTAIPTVQMLAGVVPADAVAALLALRINIECGCEGTAKISIGTMSYRDTDSGQVVQREFAALSERSDPVLQRAVIIPGQHLMANTPGFAVTPGDHYTLQVPMQAAYGSPGYVAVIFFGSDSRELGRRTLPITAGFIPLGSVTTDAEGRFSFVPKVAILASGLGILATFTGNDTVRPSALELP
jgi:hypothetical protein